MNSRKRNCFNDSLWTFFLVSTYFMSRLRKAETNMLANSILPVNVIRFFPKIWPRIELLRLDHEASTPTFNFASSFSDGLPHSQVQLYRSINSYDFGTKSAVHKTARIQSKYSKSPQNESFV